jgi:phospholipid N-methyltransferase
LIDEHFGQFLGQFGRAPFSVGAIAPSSRALAEAMIAPIDFASAPTLVELGPGTGSFTAAIVERLLPGAHYLGVEISSVFHKTLQRRFPGLRFVNQSAEDLAKIVDHAGVGPVDAIVCGLPWASLRAELQGGVFAAIDAVLRPGGVFVTFAYLQGMLFPAAWVLRRRLRREFASVETTPIVWRNLPPAFAYVCRKSE